MLTVLAVAAMLAIALLWAGQRRLIYFPDQHVPSPASVGLARAEPVVFRTDASPNDALQRAEPIELHGWWVPATRPNGWTVIVFNGNGGNRGYRAALGGSLAELGYSILLFDYRGYGGNAGSPSEEGLAEDARATLRFARTRALDPKRIAYFGESLGAAVAVRLATEEPPARLIVRSPFTSLVAVGQYHYPLLPVRWLLRDRYASIDLIRRIRCPVLVIAAARDSIVPLAQSRALYAAAAEPKRLVVIRGADHNDYELLAGQELLNAVVQFLRESGTSWE